MTDQSQAPNDQLGHVIERTDEVPPKYFSAKIGRDFASPLGGWTDDKALASRFPTSGDAQLELDTVLASIAPFCKVTQ